MYKPFKSFAEQIALLQARGLCTDAHTVDALMQEGYYAIINGYKDPFLDVTTLSCDASDRFIDGTAFQDIYQLFTFDRELRLLLFRMTTFAEARLKTACAYEFTKAHADEINPYLNLSNYRTFHKKRPVNPKQLIDTLQKVIDANNPKFTRTCKPYLAHYIGACHEVPLWVLCNDLTIGQIYWFFRCQQEKIQRNIALLFEELYNKTHGTSKEISATMLDKIYRRVKDYRNICAHDERLYSARTQPNVTLYQFIKDLQFLTTREQYCEFLQQLDLLLTQLREKLPSHFSQILKSMGFRDINEYRDYMLSAKES